MNHSKSFSLFSIFSVFYVISVDSASIDNVCDADDVNCLHSAIYKTGQTIYGKCYRDTTLRRLQRVRFLTCLKECVRTSNCSNVCYRRNWKLCDINSDPLSENNVVEEHGCLSSNIDTWSKTLGGRCIWHKCKEGYKCVPNGDTTSCVLSHCIGYPKVYNAVLKEPFGMSRDLGYGMMYGCSGGLKMTGKPFAVCQMTGKWKTLFLCGEGSLLSHQKPASQSTLTQLQLSPEEGVDGIKTAGNMFHTLEESEPYWQVDLLNEYTIYKVVSTNRIDCCGERLKKMKVQVIRRLDASLIALCGTFNGPAADAQVIEIRCRSLLQGQIVKLTSINDKRRDYFHLSEVEVYGFL